MSAISDWLELNKDNFSAEMNGYTGSPYGPYLSTLPLIDCNGKIMDLGSGNGMLLRFLMEFSHHKLIPYGLDIKTEVIKRARELIPEYKDNFIVGDVRKYDFREGPFDIIISNPFNGKPENDAIISRCLDNLNINGKLIIRIHNDVLRNSNISSITDTGLVKKYNIKVSRGDGLELGVIIK